MLRRGCGYLKSLHSSECLVGWEDQHRQNKSIMQNAYFHNLNCSLNVFIKQFNILFTVNLLFYLSIYSRVIILSSYRKKRTRKVLRAILKATRRCRRTGRRANDGARNARIWCAQRKAGSSLLCP